MSGERTRSVLLIMKNKKNLSLLRNGLFFLLKNLILSQAQDKRLISNLIYPLLWNPEIILLMLRDIRPKRQEAGPQLLELLRQRNFILQLSLLIFFRHFIIESFHSGESINRGQAVSP